MGPFAPSQQEQHFDFSSVQQNQVQLTASSVVEGFSHSQYPPDPVEPLMGAPLPPVFEEDCITSVPSYMPLNPSSPSCAYLGPGMAAYMPPPGALNTALSAESCGLYGGNILLGPEIQTQELEYQGENGRLYCTDSIQRVFNPPDLQVLAIFKLTS